PSQTTATAAPGTNASSINRRSSAFQKDMILLDQSRANRYSRSRCSNCQNALWISPEAQAWRSPWASRGGLCFPIRPPSNQLACSPRSGSTRGAMARPLLIGSKPNLSLLLRGERLFARLVPKVSESGQGKVFTGGGTLPRPDCKPSLDTLQGTAMSRDSSFASLQNNFQV